MSAPERIETPRLVLRCYRPTDAPMLKRAVDANLDHLRAWMPWAMNEPSTLEVVEERLAGFERDFHGGGDQRYGIFSPAEDELLGGTGLHLRAGPGAGEIGYWLRSDVTGRGLMTEAIAALTRHALAIPGVERIEIRCDPRNERSAAVARRLGYRHVQTLVSDAVTPEGHPRSTMVWEMRAASVRPHVVVLGAGAVGSYFGGMLARAGVKVTFIGRPAHAEAIGRDGLRLESVHFDERIAIAATTEVSAARDASLVLLCVKTVDTEEAARSLAPHLAPGAVVLCLQNGVDSAARTRAAAGIDAHSAVVYVAAEMVAPGHVRHTGRGDLIVGAGHDAIVALCAGAGIPCVVSADIDADLWTKLIMNCAYNAISALTGARYGAIARDSYTREVARHAIEETVAVARAEGIALPDRDFVTAAFTLAGSMGSALSSTAQDIQRGRPTEIDSLNGYVARRGAALGVATPTNATLHALVKLLESTTGGSTQAGSPELPESPG